MATRQSAAAESEAPEIHEKPKSTHVKYVGVANERLIDKAAWLAQGVKDQDDVIWNERNKYLVPATKFSNSALQYVRDSDDGLIFVEA